MGIAGHKGLADVVSDSGPHHDIDTEPLLRSNRNPIVSIIK